MLQMKNVISCEWSLLALVSRRNQSLSIYQYSQEEYFQNFLCDGMVLLGTAKFDGFHEKTVDESSANHHQNENQQSSVDEIEVNCIIIVAVVKPPYRSVQVDELKLKNRTMTRREKIFLQSIAKKLYLPENKRR